jgi:hypothetical protein
MPSRKRSSRQDRSGRGPWLPSDERPRSRPWAYEELLFGMSDDREQMRELGALEEELESERDELARLHQQLDEHVVRISNLERRLGQLTPAEGDEPRPVPLKTLPRTRAAPAGTGDFGAISEELSYALARCEGFEVDSPTGLVGLVEGLRFVSRIDRPDLLEVRGGRFGRQLLLTEPSDAWRALPLGACRDKRHRWTGNGEGRGRRAGAAKLAPRTVPTRPGFALRQR